MPLKSEDRSENKEENYTKWLLLVLPEGSYFAGRILFFLCYHHRMRPKPVLTISGVILQLLTQWETSYRVAPMLVPGLAFLRGLLPHLELLCRSISLRHLWSPSHCLCSIRWKLFTNHLKDKAPFASRSQLLPAPTPHEARGTQLMLLSTAWQTCLLLRLRVLRDFDSF